MIFWHVSRFQFTPLMRGATTPPPPNSTYPRFNSRPSCEGRQNALDRWMIFDVSIHAPHARGDDIGFEMLNLKGFNSRPSCEGRRVRPLPTTGAVVSIHAPHARGDTSEIIPDKTSRFQFTPLMRGATSRSRRPSPCGRFNSRPSCEGRRQTYRRACCRPVSIHAPHARGDILVFGWNLEMRVSIHAPHARGDIAFLRLMVLQEFQFTPLMRGATSS